MAYGGYGPGSLVGLPVAYALGSPWPMPEADASGSPLVTLLEARASGSPSGMPVACAAGSALITLFHQPRRRYHYWFVSNILSRLLTPLSYENRRIAGNVS